VNATETAVSKRLYRAATVFSALFFLLAGLFLIWFWEIRGVRHLAANLLGTYLFVWAVVLVHCPAARRELHVRFALLTITLGLVGATLEALSLSGLVDYRILFGDTRAGWYHSDNLLDEELLFTRRPHLEVSGTGRGNISSVFCLPEKDFPTHTYNVQYDYNGFRNANDLETASIAVVGDSYIEAIAIPYEETFSQQLAQLSGEPVANLALSDYGPQQQLAVLRRFGLPLDPEVIVWAFYEGNDLNDIEDYDQALEQLRREGANTGGTARDRSFTKNALNAVYRLIDRCKPWSGARRYAGGFRAADGRELRMYFIDAPNPLEASELAALRRLREILAQAYELSAQGEARLVLLYIPAKYRVYESFLDLPTSSELADWGISDLPDRLETMVRDVSPDIGFVDLTAPFLAAAEQGAVLYRPDDTHWTPEGHRLAADALWTYLSRPEGVEIER
jgi:hypothetical protein